MPVSNKIPVPPRERIGYEIDYGAPRERVGYSVNYAAPTSAKHIERESFWRQPRNESRLGLLMFGGGLIWAVKVETIDISNFFRLLLTPGPLEICAIGLLVWLHAKWRRSIRLK